MIPFTDITGLAGATLAVTASLLLAPPIRRLKRTHAGLLMCVTAAIVSVPIGALPPAAYVRGWFGDPSVTTTVLLAMAIFSHLSGRRPVDGKQRFAMNALIAVAALVFYPLALGIGPFDPYRTGYGSPWLLAGLLVLSLWAWAARFHLIAVCIALSVAAHSISWYESTNLWDYLLDPLVSIYALVAVIRGALGNTISPEGEAESTRCT